MITTGCNEPFRLLNDTASGMEENSERDEEKLVDSGIEFYKLTRDVAKWYYSAAIEGAWKEAEGRYPADLVQRYKQYQRR